MRLRAQLRCLQNALQASWPSLDLLSCMLYEPVCAMLLIFKLSGRGAVHVIPGQCLELQPTV